MQKCGMNVSNSGNSIAPSWASTGTDQDFVSAIEHCVDSKGDPQKEALDLLLRYDEETGNLIWKPRPRCCFVSAKGHGYWNAVYGGHVAGAENWSAPKSKPEKRRRVCILLTFTRNLQDEEIIRRKLAHRIIWTMQVGRIPEGMNIDHKNRNAFDNRLTNLRLATDCQNMWNKTKPKSIFGKPVSSKYIGVSLHSPGFWTAVFRKKYLGLFRSEIEAAICRDNQIPKDDEFTIRNFSPNPE
jgi:hypothetical protein